MRWQQVSPTSARTRSIPIWRPQGAFPRWRLHAGAWHGNDTLRWFIGADRDVTKRLNLSVDYLSGNDNAASIAAGYRLADRLDLPLTVLFPNTGGGAEYALNLAFSSAYRGE